MALIKSFEEVEKQYPEIHRPVKCGYCSFIGSDDRRYLLLETYGTEDRQMPEKISQSIQLDEEGARQLMDIIRREFPTLA